jgi:hypothetical protein
MREAHRLLDSFGLAIGVHKVEIIDFDLAGHCHIHHTQLPIALVGYALVSPAFARGRFPEFSFIDLIRKRPSMDETEVIALAEVCRIAVQPPFWSNPGPFSDHLWDVIDRYALWPFFVRVDRHFGAGGHYAMRPRGFDWSLPDQPELVGALAQWRKDYKGIPPAMQLMVATILQLYLQDEDRVWMVRVPKKWHAAEGIEILEHAGFLRDWAKLYVLYPGW